MNRAWRSPVWWLGDCRGTICTPTCMQCKQSPYSHPNISRSRQFYISSREMLPDALRSRDKHSRMYLSAKNVGWLSQKHIYSARTYALMCSFLISCTWYMDGGYTSVEVYLAIPPYHLHPTIITSVCDLAIVPPWATCVPRLPVDSPTAILPTTTCSSSVTVVAIVCISTRVSTRAARIL